MTSSEHSVLGCELGTECRGCEQDSLTEQIEYVLLFFLSILNYSQIVRTQEEMYARNISLTVIWKRVKTLEVMKTKSQC